jgi:hypothetical protein
MHLLGS